MGLLNRLFGKKQFQLVEVVELTSLEIFANAVAQVRAIIQQNALPALGSNPDEFKKEAWNIIFELVIFS